MKDVPSERLYDKSIIRFISDDANYIQLAQNLCSLNQFSSRRSIGTSLRQINYSLH
ncbi:MAG: hypothetical protein KME54_25465 [Tolypothrix brevis GSE-NOS-MK-07-07A]|nr:hypothetical protein [Tolypothrix brevis GSE-NOS-MK-07-07A]